MNVCRRLAGDKRLADRPSPLHRLFRLGEIDPGGEELRQKRVACGTSITEMSSSFARLPLWSFVWAAWRWAWTVLFRPWAISVRHSTTVVAEAVPARIPLRKSNPYEHRDQPCQVHQNALC